MGLESLYARLPVLLQHLACSLEGLRVRRQRYGGSFDEILRQAEARLAWSRDRLLGYRDARLRAFLEHCGSTVPYYRRLFAARRWSPRETPLEEILGDLPILLKTTVQALGGEFESSDVPPHRRVPSHTSGTTGGGLHFQTTRTALQEQYAVWWRYWRLHGLRRGTLCGYFAGRSVVPPAQTRPPFWRHNVPGRQILFSGYHMAPRTLPSYVDELRRAQPPWLHGYPSLLSLLAAFVLDSGRGLGYTPIWVTCGAENLLPHQAALIARALGRSPIQHYGLAEAVANFSTCPQNRLHVDEDFSHVEFVPLSDGEGFRVVGTNFTNPATPLVRYDAGDTVRLDPGHCGCGLAGRLVMSVDGRQEDYVVLKNGARLGRLDHIFKDMLAIREAQIVQEMPGVITVKIVRRAGFRPDDEAALRREFQVRLGDQARVHFEYVPHLQRSRSGKLRFVVSTLPAGDLHRTP